MASKALFDGVIYDESNKSVDIANVGSEAFYVVNDDGFLRHVPSEQIDRQILRQFTDQMKGNEDYLSKQAANMFGMADIFTVAILKNQLLNIDSEIDKLFETGIPDEAKKYLALSGMKINIDYHGEIVGMQLPTAPDNNDDD